MHRRSRKQLRHSAPRARTSNRSRCSSSAVAGFAWNRTEQLAVFHDPIVEADQAAFILAVFGELTHQERRAFLDLVTKCITHLSSPLTGSGAHGSERNSHGLTNVSE
jgi:hypothetical protein